MKSGFILSGCDIVFNKIKQLFCSHDDEETRRYYKKENDTYIKLFKDYKCIKCGKTYTKKILFEFNLNKNDKIIKELINGR